MWFSIKTTASHFYHDNGFFLAMGLAFNLLLYFIPLVLLMIALLGYTFLESSRAMTEVQSFVGQLLPQSEHIFADNFAAIVAHRGLLGATGWIFFVLFSSTLFGSARHVLNTVFKTPVRRTFVKGLLRDFLMMTLTAIIVVLAIGAGILGSLARAFGADTFPLLAPLLGPVGWVAGKMVSLTLLAILFYIFYRYAPAQSLSPRALMIGSISATLLFVLLRWGFAWYVGFARDALALYGVVSGLMFFFFWLYYASLVFILGAEIGYAVDQIRPPAI